MTELIKSINNSKLLVGVAAIMATIGGKYIDFELDDNCKRFLNRPMVRKVLVFMMAFWVTRDLQTALLLTLIFIMVVKSVTYVGSDEEMDDEV